ncbi:hypothetical protein EVAR_65813_1, partial [Eumeta japonica]
ILLHIIIECGVLIPTSSARAAAGAAAELRPKTANENLLILGDRRVTALSSDKLSYFSESGARLTYPIQSREAESAIKSAIPEFISEVVDRPTEIISVHPALRFPKTTHFLSRRRLMPYSTSGRTGNSDLPEIECVDEMERIHPDSGAREMGARIEKWAYRNLNMFRNHLYAHAFI